MERCPTVRRFPRALAAAASLVLLASACAPHTVLRTTSAGGAATTSGATETPSPTAPPEPEAPLPRAWLWRVSGGDAPSPSYLLGTMHVGVRMPDALPHPYDDYLHQTRALVMEVDFREAERYLAESARAPRGARSRRLLDRALGRETWDRLVAELGQRVPAELLRHIPPGAVTLYLQQVRMAEAEAIAEGREPIPGVPSSARLDLSIFDWAIREGCPIVALETPAQALAALDAVAEPDVLEGLRQIVDHADEARAEAASLRDAYLAFDPSAVVAAASAGLTPAARDALLVQRNRAWEAALFPQIRQGNAFVAVGLAHLLGEGSVVEALRARGYTVERVDGSVE